MILKIIFIVLAGLVAIVLALLALLLLLPIRYDISGELQETQKPIVKARLRYCFSILKFVLSYQDDSLQTFFYLFGFQRKMKEDEVIEEEEEAEEIPSIQKAEKTKEMDAVQKESRTEEKKEILKHNSFSETKTEGNKKAQQLKGAYATIKEQLTDEHNKSIINKIFSELRYLLKHFKFRKIKTNLQFSLGDPALTGQIFGILCIIPALYQYEMVVEPDFESDKPYVYGTFSASGKIRLIHFLRSVLQLLLDKEVRSRVKKLMDRN